MNVRLAQVKDLPALMEIFHEAQGTIAALGIDQWQNGYPSEAVIAQDISLGRSYVVEQEGILCGTFVLVGEELSYDCIHEGHWETERYIAIHRVAVSVSYRGTGVAEAVICYAERYARDWGREALRIDTHRGNLPMRKMLQKQGFRYRGIIYLPDGAPRVAYEKSVPGV